MVTKTKVKTLVDAAEALWGVVANASDWNKQNKEWCEAAERARDDYHEAAKLLSPSEALFSMLGWLSTRKGTLKIGAKHNCGKLAELIGAFCVENHPTEPRESWHKTCVKHPKLFLCEGLRRVDVFNIMEGQCLS